jgi:hypothetical protein
MNKGLDGLIDVAMLVVFAAIGLSITFASIVLMSDSHSTGQIEKATVLSISDNPPTEPVFDAVDLTIMMVIQDNFMQVPTTIAFTTPANNNYFIEDNTSYHDKNLLATPPVRTVVYDKHWFADRDIIMNSLWSDLLKGYTTPTVEKNIHMFLDDNPMLYNSLPVDYRLVVVLPRR